MHVRSRSTGQVSYFYLSLFLSFFPVKFLLILFSYLDQMTGFYLCLVHLMVSCATLYLRAEFLLKDLAVYPSNASDVAILTRHHFGNLDSVNSMGSSSVSYQIRTIITEPRPRSISSLKGNKRACSLEEVVQTFYQIPTIITDRKPSSNLLGRYYSNEGPSSVLRFEDSYGCKSNEGKVAPNNLIPLKQLQIKTNHHRLSYQTSISTI